jgi:S-adenosylmethionine:tRNA ribosyltransferase-isomerase
MRTEDFDYELPDDRIARTPAERGRARLLVLDAEGAGRHRSVSDLPGLLRRGDLLVVNDTRVLPARLLATRVPSGGRVELLLLDGDGPTRWRAMAKPAKRLAPGARLRIEPGGGDDRGTRADAAGDDAVEAVVEARGEDGVCWLRFSVPALDVLERFGAIPLPPYLRRAPVPEDRDWYQTVYATEPGAVAAPTAGLHLTQSMLAALEEHGVERVPITLHVGPGTFKPVKAEHVEDHRLEAERYVVPESTVRAIARTRERGGRVVAVGTTVVRCLEAAAIGGLQPGPGSTELFIQPGYRFQVVDVLLTNFHLPRSTLLMLVAAFAGKERVLDAYREAIAAGYRFYSYGDAMVAARRSGAP